MHYRRERRGDDPTGDGRIQVGLGRVGPVSVVDKHFFHLRAELLRQRDRARLVVAGANVHPTLHGTGPCSEVIDECLRQSVQHRRRQR